RRQSGVVMAVHRWGGDVVPIIQVQVKDRARAFESTLRQSQKIAPHTPPQSPYKIPRCSSVSTISFAIAKADDGNLARMANSRLALRQSASVARGHSFPSESNTEGPASPPRLVHQNSPERVSPVVPAVDMLRPQLTDAGNVKQAATQTRRIEQIFGPWPQRPA